MSITGKSGDSATGKECFYCYKKLVDPAICWMGASRELLLLHKACVFELFTRLCRDVHEMECPTYYANVHKGLELLLLARREDGPAPDPAGR